MGLLTWQLGKKVWMRVGERGVRSRSKNIKIFKKYLLVYIRQSTYTDTSRELEVSKSLPDRHTS